MPNPKELEKLREWEKEFDRWFEEYQMSEVTLNPHCWRAKYTGETLLERINIKDFIRKAFQERDKLLVEFIKGLKTKGIICMGDDEVCQKGCMGSTKEAVLDDVLSIINNIEPK